MEENELTEKQEEVLEFITKFIAGQGFSPSVRDITKHFKLASPNSAKKYLTILEDKGFINRKPNCSRAIEVLSMRHSKQVPILGQIRAGAPHQAVENIEGYLAMDRSIARWDNAFLLKVQGDSMIEDHIQDGDLALIKPQPSSENGDIVAALIGDEATLKRFYKEKKRIRLQPANKNMKPIIISNEEIPVTIVGKVVAIVRQLATETQRSRRN
jgi:repressor LexA